jgi:hypothetical protein
MLNSSPIKAARALAYRLIKDPLQNDSHEAQAMTASEWKHQLRRTYGGEFHRVANEAFSEAVQAAQVPIWKRADFAHDFYGKVSRLTRGDASVAADNQAIAAALQKASGAAEEVLRGDDRGDEACRRQGRGRHRAERLLHEPRVAPREHP